MFSQEKVAHPLCVCVLHSLFAGQLGDGRAVSLFETETPEERWEVQLKGAGRTPYSRFGDGYAVLRSSIREFLISEHMYALGVPTTRALSLISTSRLVYRDDAPSSKTTRRHTRSRFSSCFPSFFFFFLLDVKQPETGAIVTRMAPSWLRIGNFEIFYSRNDMDNVRKLADYVWEELFQATPDASAKPEENRYAGVLRNVARRTANMVAEWQALGNVIPFPLS